MLNLRVSRRHPSSFCLEMYVEVLTHPPLPHVRSPLKMLFRTTNYGQVLGKTLSRLARAQVAEAWKLELKARDYETRLLEELEVRHGLCVCMCVFSWCRVPGCGDFGAVCEKCRRFPQCRGRYVWFLKSIKHQSGGVVIWDRLQGPINSTGGKHRLLLTQVCRRKHGKPTAPRCSA